MEGLIRSRVREMVEALAREHQAELAAAGTLADLEKLTCEIGDEFARQLCEKELEDRGRQAAEAERKQCPTCGASCPREESEPTVLQGLRGEMGFNQPTYFCRRCRRSFFPSRCSTGSAGAEHGYAAGFATDGLGRQQSRQLYDGRRGDA
jgi:hypothetical protein